MEMQHLKKLRGSILSQAAMIQATFPHIDPNDPDIEELERIHRGVQSAVDDLDFACIRIQRLILNSNENHK